jgi:hypothetical protein
MLGWLLLVGLCLLLVRWHWYLIVVLERLGGRLEVLNDRFRDKVVLSLLILLRSWPEFLNLRERLEILCLRIIF